MENGYHAWLERAFTIDSEIDNKTEEFIKSQKWYHQRFDGCPLLLSMVGWPETWKEKRKPIGTEASFRICFYIDEKADWYMLENDNEAATRVFFEAAKIDAAFAKNIMTLWNDSEQDFYNSCEEIEKTDLRQLDDQKLLSLYQKFMLTYMKRMSSSSIIDGFALGSDKMIAKRVHQHLEQIGRSNEYNTLFPALTAPVHISFTNEAHVELLKITIKINETKELKQIFDALTPEEIVTKLGDFPEYTGLYHDMTNHQKRFFWLHNNYIDAHILSLEYFVYEIKKLFEEGIDLKHEYRFVSSHPNENRKRKDRLVNELQLPQDLQNLISYSEEYTHWQDERKKSTFFAAHYTVILLDEVGRRFGYDRDELKYILPTEIELVFAKKLKREVLRERMGGCLVTLDERNGRVITGKKAMDLYEEVKRLDIPKDLKVIKGLPASLGRAVGRAKVVKSSKEVGKVEKGDILVAVMTRPDYVIGMKRAAAIVTDEGGLTCHAAIVSREFRLPCIIGTKFASTVICDNDIVEVNAEKGEVRIIERAGND